MHNEPEAMTRRRLPRVGRLVAAVIAIAMLGVAPVRAQSVDRDSLRVYRAQVRRGDTVYVRTLRATRKQLEGRVDSLKREFEGLGFNAPDRVDVLQELRTTLSALANLSALEQRSRVRYADPGAGELQRAKERVRESVEAMAGSLRGSIASLQPGWIGINAEAPHERVVRGDSAYIRYFGYPEIVSVEPNSPAERVGIARGDQIIAYDGADLREREINLTRLLQPSRRITVRVRREGEEREFPVVVVRAPARLAGRLTLSVPDGLLDSMPGRVMMLRRAPTARAGSAPVLVDPMEPGFVPVAGAKLVEIHDESLGQIFGVSSGVLVTEVFTNPARSSGLRGGDVILGADHQEITHIAQLRRIIDAHNSDRSIELEIMRQKKTRFLTLRW